MSELIPRHVRRMLAGLRGGGAEEGKPGLVVQAPRALGERREVTGALGVCASLRLLPGEVHPGLEGWMREAQEALAGSALDPARGHRVVFLDLETLSLSGAPVFLVGLAHAGGGGLHVHQFLARDYSEEAAMLETAREVVERAECLVTYNGRTFDCPYLRDRMRYHRMPALVEAREHADLLYTARRLYRGVLPDCSLGTVETNVLGLRRQGDVAGEQIPRVYHEAVAQGDLNLLAPVLYHNQVDLLSLACLAGRWREHLPPAERIR